MITVGTALGSRDSGGDLEVVSAVDCFRHFIAPAYTIGRNAFRVAVLHADDSTAGDRIDNGIDNGAVRDSHDIFGRAVRHLGGAGDRACLEEHKGISGKQTILLGNIAAQLRKVQLEFYVPFALLDGKFLKAVGARYLTALRGIVRVVTREEIRERAYLHRDIVWRPVVGRFVVFITQSHSQRQNIPASACRHREPHIMDPRRHGAGSGGARRGICAGGQRIQLPRHIGHLIFDDQSIHELLHRGGAARRVHGDDFIKVALLALVQPFDQLIQGGETGAVLHREGVVLDQGAVGVHQAQLQHLRVQRFLRFRRKNGCWQKPHQQADGHQQAQDPVFHDFSPPFGSRSGYILLQIIPVFPSALLSGISYRTHPQTGRSVRRPESE